MAYLTGHLSSAADLSENGREVNVTLTATGLAAATANTQGAGFTVGQQAAIAAISAATPDTPVAATAGGNTGAAPIIAVPSTAPNTYNVKYTVSANTIFGIPTGSMIVGTQLALLLTSGGSYSVGFNAVFRDAPSTWTSTIGQKATAFFVYDGTSWQFIGGSSVFA